MKTSSKLMQNVENTLNKQKTITKQFRLLATDKMGVFNDIFYFLQRLFVVRNIQFIGKNTTIHKSTSLKSKEKIHLGHNCLISEFVIIDGKTNHDIGIDIRNYVQIKPKAYISANNGNIKILDNCGIGHNSWIGGKGYIVIGPNTLIGMNTVIISSTHDYHHIITPFYNGEEIINEVVIGANVWVGANCTILPGSKIGSNSVVAAGTVIKGEVPPDSIICGHPENYQIKPKKIQ